MPTATSVTFDTWAWVEVFRGTPRGAALWKKYGTDATNLSTSVLTLAELAATLRGQETEPTVDALLAFIEGRSRVHAVSPNQARKAAALRAELRSVRPGAGLVDALILALAEDLGSVLISADPAFGPRANVRPD